MAHMHSKVEIPIKQLRQPTADQLNFRLRCDLSHDTRNFGFMLVLLIETDEYIEVAYGHFITVKQTGEN